MTTSLPTYYLSSLDSERLEAVRKCEFVKQLAFDTGKQCVLARVSPPIPGQDFGQKTDIDLVVLANRHEGERLLPIAKFPCFVFVARVRGAVSDSPVRERDLEIVGWGELYRSAEQAQTHAFE